MANHAFSPIEGALHSKISLLDGYVRVSTSGTIVSQTVKGATVARSNTGLYTITLAETFPSLVSINITPVCATATDIKAQIVSEFVSTTKVITVRFVAVATAADLPTNGGFYVSMVLKNSAVS